MQNNTHVHKVINVVGARPNFMKVSPIHQRMVAHPNFNPILVHTGQHYDNNMSKIFFDELGLPEPDYYLGVGSDSHAKQTAKIMVEFESILFKEKPNIVLVAGDVNSTIACALATVKLNIKVAHIESGLRSFDRKMPEEINRVLTDSISDYLFVTEKSGLENLKTEGVSDEKIFHVGNTMIDWVFHYLDKADRSTVLRRFDINQQDFVLVTLHRPSNVDDQTVLEQILNALEKIQEKIKIIFPIHPRTKKKIDDLEDSNYMISSQNICFCEPLGYLDFLKLIKSAKVVLTDSGGIQEESTALGVPCLTLRENTERPITIEKGTNKLVEISTEKIIKSVEEILSNANINSIIPSLWDGNASGRIIDILNKRLSEL
ncbi:MAG: UDP-N-acetylglucosamine 2-epimerase (non-hydrolyzing) [Lentimicrobiaceae bacterium]|jgi:UDP-N-acetylglucosamine 2-epimerase (non-hydrolysing)|nr:UDP-N-acetylglucosamine 2-epimerase (non-hydrolyzing) [Candidatus Scalindua sp.]MBT6671086.1 UDP-N-acetylglucosamine 2-epimerase (non-hydrolyzing) [Lentimicrobiaceae bacterium]MBT7035369.1 UDP-N-acetylglucosamine 2-epimerase (non-hydrolyzing) [Lentimicrobiaceae bacterium]